MNPKVKNNEWFVIANDEHFQVLRFKEADDNDIMVSIEPLFEPLKATKENIKSALELAGNLNSNPNYDYTESEFHNKIKSLRVKMMGNKLYVPYLLYDFLGVNHSILTLLNYEKESE